MDTLTYIESVSLNRFKTINGISKINIVKNPKTDKIFFTCPEDSKFSGKVSKVIDYAQPLMVSTCMDKETGAQFYMLHNQADSSANVLQAL